MLGVPFLQYLVVFTTCWGTFATSQATNDQKHRLVEWLRSHDGIFSDKISFDPPPASAGDSKAGGLYATQPIPKGERLMFIPRTCLFKPRRDSRDRSVCGTVKRLADEYLAGEGQSDMWPYLQYVFESFPHDHLPSAWSRNAQTLFANIVGIDMHEPNRIGRFESCPQYYERNNPEYNRLLDTARRIVDSRGWDEVLVPVFDMGNHRNGYWHNMDQLHDSRTSKDFEIVALRDIEAGEQLYLSYNQCPDHTCVGEEYTFITPDLFRVYGFVEQYPQRWRFHIGDGDDDYLLFELDQAASSLTKAESQGFKVTWLKGDTDFQNKYQIEWMQVHLKRLEGMKDFVLYEARYLKPHEGASIVSYYEALSNALRQAIASGTQGNDPLDGYSDGSSSSQNFLSLSTPYDESELSRSLPVGGKRHGGNEMMYILVLLPVAAAVYGLKKYRFMFMGNQDKSHDT